MILAVSFFLGIVVVAGTLGEIAVSHTMKQIGEIHSIAPRVILPKLGRAFRSGWMWLGLSLMAIAFFSLLTLLSWQPVSFVIPASALSYAVGALGGKFLLKERVCGLRWAGVLLVCMGVALVWHG